MARTPRIATTTWRRTMPTFLADRTGLYTFGAEYPQSVLDVGGLPVLLPHHEPTDAERALEAFHGLILVGAPAAPDRSRPLRSLRRRDGPMRTTDGAVR